MPEHAFLNHSGNDWKCHRGFKRVAERCEEIPVPEHAFLNHSGNRWQCDRGFKRVAALIGNTPRARSRPWAFPDRELPHPPGRRGSPRASSRLEQSPATVHAVGTLRPAPLRVLFRTAGPDRDLSVHDLPAVRTKTYDHGRAPVIVVGTELSPRHSPHSSSDRVHWHATEADDAPKPVVERNRGKMGEHLRPRVAAPRVCSASSICGAW